MSVLCHCHCVLRVRLISSVQKKGVISKFYAVLKKINAEKQNFILKLIKNIFSTHLPKNRHYMSKRCKIVPIFLAFMVYMWHTSPTIWPRRCCFVFIDPPIATARQLFVWVFVYLSCHYALLRYSKTGFRRWNTEGSSFKKPIKHYMYFKFKTFIFLHLTTKLKQ